MLTNKVTYFTGDFLTLVTLHNFSYLVCTDRYQGSRRTKLATIMCEYQRSTLYTKYEKLCRVTNVKKSPVK
jgi:hypothetical protein